MFEICLIKDKVIGKRGKCKIQDHSKNPLSLEIEFEDTVIIHNEKN